MQKETCLKRAFESSLEAMFYDSMLSMEHAAQLVLGEAHRRGWGWLGLSYLLLPDLSASHHGLVILGAFVFA